MRRPEPVSCMLIPSPMLPNPASLSCDTNRMLRDSACVMIVFPPMSDAGNLRYFEDVAK
jgi:hypothetical protein